jgi:hypothetical protein
VNGAPERLQGMCFILTQAKYEMPMTDQEEEKTEAETEGENYSPENDRLRGFDKAEIRAIIQGAGGRILQATPHPHPVLTGVADPDPKIWIRSRRIRMFLGLPNPGPLVRDADPDPDPSNIKQK